MISSEVNVISDSKKELKITMGAEELENIRNSQVKEVRKEVAIPGYRKGNAPENLVIKKYRDTIEKYTLDAALKQGIKEALDTNDIIPSGQPVLKKINYDENKNLLLEVEVEVFPDINLKKYKGIEIEKIIYKITEEDVNNQLELLRKKNAIVSSIKDIPSKLGNYLTINMQELDDSGVPVIGKKYDNIRFQLGEGKFDIEIEEQLSGLKNGDEKVIQKIYPANFHQKQLAGKMERYLVTVTKVEDEELPDLDQDFLQSIDPDIETVDQLKERIKNQLEIRFKQESENQFYNQLIHELLQQNPFDMPESILSDYLDQIVNDVKKKDKNVDEDVIRKNYKADALFNIKWFYLRKKIADVEKIEANENDLKMRIEKIEDKKIRDIYNGNEEMKKRLLHDIFERKIFDFITDNAKIKIKEELITKERKFT